MDEKQGKHPNDAAADEALRDEASKPEPLYEKTNRNFQRAEQDGAAAQPKEENAGRGSSSGEEKDITV